MKTNVFLGIAIRIIILCLVGMAWTYVPEHLADFFGDQPCTYKFGCGFDRSDIEWGARHYWYWWMMFLLFLLSLINAVLQIIKLVNTNYDTKKW